MKRWRRKAGRYLSQNRVAVALVLIIGLAIFFRFWQLYDIPPGLYEDEAANGLDIFRIQEGDIRPFYPANNGRESLFFFLQAIFVTIFGNSIIALRIAPALIGGAAVLATYALSREWFGRRAGLVAALITASAPWAVTMSRNGFRAGMMILMIPLTLWLFTKAAKQKSWLWYVLAGVSFGAGFYTYLAYRFAIVVVVALFIYALIFYRQWLRQHFVKLLLAGLAALIVVTPLAVYGLKHPDEVFNTRSSVSVSKADQPVVTLAKNIGKTALMFNVTGDGNYRHNLGGAPMLNAFIGIMFLLGALISLRRWRDWRYFTLLAIFGVMLLPEVLSAEGIPHSLRAIGVVPAVYILAAVGIRELIRRWRAIFPHNPAALTTGLTILGLLLVLSTYYDYQRYFQAWANAPQTYEAYSEDAVAMADYMVERPANQYVVVVDINKNRTIEYLTHNKVSYTRIESSQVPDLKGESNYILIVVGSVAKDIGPHVETAGGELVYTKTSDERAGTVLYKVYQPKPQNP